ncbi:NADPH:quinone reductase [Companilactobacillus sp. RD055328]|uniref:zinc-binding alcohol dehydrogenase family protein n=1 Tax=Companilactobacillus sp. RD055328 TaxID=2916634 RepID=UPI001FC88E20|nr:zinc-binding alcohol dehydrogenase family protein [Companilactobacillus sp. RD055328]GKQ42979.1 NADPH:quinone reductase [Companilactobacillus sp. RD055328]
MKAFGFKKYYPIDHQDSFTEFSADRPQLRNHDVLVEIQGISLNPVDIATRKQVTKELDKPMIVGFDGYGKIVDKGSQVDKFDIGDVVFFAGDHSREGSYAEYTAIDERIVALAPTKVSLEEAVAMPLTSLTAYEALVDKLGIDLNADNSDKSVLIINGSGGVGSIATQLAKIARLHVTATASPKNTQWVTSLGADEVIDHHQDLVKQLNDKMFDYILVFAPVDPHWDEIVHLIKPFGKIVAITNMNSNINDLKPKAASFEWEYMFAKSLYQTQNMATQGQYLSDIARWLDEGKIKSTLNKTFVGFNLNNIKEATKLLEDGHVTGKIVIKKDVN